MGRLDSWTTTADQCNICFLHFVDIFLGFFSCGDFLFLKFFTFSIANGWSVNVNFISDGVILWIINTNIDKESLDCLSLVYIVEFESFSFG